MNFTYETYREMLKLLQEKGYAITNYHEFLDCKRCVILRHDIDSDIAQAVRMAEVEAACGVRSTYFVLLRTGFYNPAFAPALAKLHRIQELGHELGLHFDEAAYPIGTPEETAGRILQERDILSLILKTPVTTVSMHRPSRATLEANLRIPGMVNSYGQTFFHNFKYLSDSRRRWREPVADIICGGIYDRLHILTHPFWYHDEDQTQEQCVSDFVNNANRQRYAMFKENITDLETIMKESEVR